MGVGGSINILIKADLTKYVAHRPSVLYWVLQPGSNVGGIGMGVVRMVRTVERVAARSGATTSTQPAPTVTEEICEQLARQLIGDDEIPIDVTVLVDVDGQPHARRRATRRAACSAWATPCTGIRRATASAPTPRSRTRSTWRWKLALVLKGHAGAGAARQLLEPSARPSASRSSTAPTSRSASSARSSARSACSSSTDPEVMNANMAGAQGRHAGRARSGAGSCARRSPSRSTSSTRTAWR